MPDMGLAGGFGAGGAGDAMQTLFDQRMRAAQLAQTDALTRLKVQEQADSLRQNMETRRQVEADRIQAAKDHRQQIIDAQLQRIAPDTNIGQKSVTGMTDAGILPERFQPAPTTPITAPMPPPGIASPDAQPETPMPGTVANSPTPMFRRAPTSQEAAQQKLLNLFPVDSKQRALIEYEMGTGKNAPASFEGTPKLGAIHDTPTGLVRIGDDNAVTPVTDPTSHKQVQGYHAPPQTVVVQTPAGPQVLDKGAKTATPITSGGAVVGPVPTAATRTRESMANKLVGHFDEAQAELDEAEKQGLLGPLAGRTFGEFLTGKVGSTGDDATDQLLGSLRMDLSALSSGFASLHGRGGANAPIAKSLSDKLDTSYMSHGLIAGALQKMKDFTVKYSQPEGGGKAAPKKGDAKKFPNGTTGIYDGTGWVKQ